VYFLMSEENIKKQIRPPRVSFDSDAASQAPDANARPDAADAWPPPYYWLTCAAAGVACLAAGLGAFVANFSFFA
jgi:hypothetical protein